LVTKSNSLKVIDKAIEIGGKNEISGETLKNLKALKEDINVFTIKAPLLGGFNAGKSSLINNYLGNKKLPTDITPETTIAAEIKYGEEEKIVAVKKDGSTKFFNIEAIKDITPTEYKYIEVYQNNANLKKLDNIVIVDMPGLDSFIEAHNQAICNYIKEGTFYIILVDSEFGLKESVLNFLREVNLYNIEFAILVTKKDKKLPEDVNSIIKHTKQIIRQLSEKEVFVGSTSIMDNDIGDFISILNNINYNQIIRKKYSGQIIEHIDRIIRELNIRLKYSSSDSSEIEKKINELNKQLKGLELSVREQEMKLTREFDGRVIDNIMCDVELSLRSNLSTLVQAAKQGGDSFSRAVTNILRPTLNLTINENITPVLDESYKDIESIMANVLKGISSMPDKLKGPEWEKILNYISNTKWKGILTVIALLTNFIAPWIELIIIFLPDIIKLFIY